MNRPHCSNFKMGNMFCQTWLFFKPLKYKNWLHVLSDLHAKILKYHDMIYEQIRLSYIFEFKLFYQNRLLMFSNIKIGDIFFETQLVEFSN